MTRRVEHRRAQSIWCRTLAVKRYTRLEVAGGICRCRSGAVRACVAFSAHPRIRPWVAGYDATAAIVTFLLSHPRP